MSADMRLLTNLCKVQPGQQQLNTVCSECLSTTHTGVSLYQTTQIATLSAQKTMLCQAQWQLLRSTMAKLGTRAAALSFGAVSSRSHSACCDRRSVTAPSQHVCAPLTVSLRRHLRLLPCRYWQRKGDVYRVLHALCRLLDSRTWPVEDLELVSLLFTVLEHTTNSRRLKAHFVPKAALARQLGLADDAGGKSQPKQQEKEMERQQQQQPRAIAAAAPAGPPGGAATPTHPAGAAAAPPITARQPQQQQQNGGPGHSVANIKVGQDSHSLTNVSPTDGAAAAAAATARRTSAELHRTRSKPLVPGVAYVRLSPPPSPRPPGLTAEQEIAAEAAANAALPPGDMPTDQIRESCCDSMRLAGTPAVSSPAAGAEQQHMAAASATRARSAAMLEEGCRVDPAAAVVASEPLAPPAAQSVFGSRKALKGVTAQELLAEPVVQSLLKRLE